MQLVKINQDTVKQILSDAELFNRVAEDGISYKDYYPEPNKLYLGIFQENIIIGFWVVEPENASTLEIHCNVLEKYRENSMVVGRYFLNYMADSYNNVQKLNCKIPVTYPDVYNFTKKFGFKDEGLDRKSIMKNGELVDRHVLGITREEIENGRS